MRRSNQVATPVRRRGQQLCGIAAVPGPMYNDSDIVWIRLGSSFFFVILLHRDHLPSAVQPCGYALYTQCPFALRSLIGACNPVNPTPCSIWGFSFRCPGRVSILGPRVPPKFHPLPVYQQRYEKKNKKKNSGTDTDRVDPLVINQFQPANAFLLDCRSTPSSLPISLSLDRSIDPFPCNMHQCMLQHRQ